MTKKKHLYEVDLMRCFFMFGVVLNHVASTFAAALGNTATPCRPLFSINPLDPALSRLRLYVHHRPGSLFRLLGPA